MSCWALIIIDLNVTAICLEVEVLDSNAGQQLNTKIVNKSLDLFLNYLFITQHNDIESIS